MAHARDTGLAAESGVAPDEDAEAALPKLDAWLCDLKDMQIGDGLHVFGQTAGADRRNRRVARRPHRVAGRPALKR